jgi:hypothetical protein
VPAFDEFQRPIDHLEVMGFGRILRPLIRSSKIKSSVDPPQKRLHMSLVPFHSFQPAILVSFIAKQVPAGFWAKTRNFAQNKSFGGVIFTQIA